MDEQLPVGVPIEGMSWKGKLYIEVESLNTYLSDVAELWADQLVTGDAAPTQIREALRLWEMEWHLDPPPPLTNPADAMRAQLREWFGE